MEGKQKQKFEAFYALIRASSPTYRESDDETFQSFIETTLGAALFYLPQNKQLHFSGMISKSANELLKVDPLAKVTKDHYYPRKVSARHLLTTDYSLNEVIQMCNEKYLRYHLVTPKENKLLTPFQTVAKFESPEKSYKDANIELVPFSENEEN